LEWVMDWIDLTQDRDGRLAVVNTVNNLRVPLTRWPWKWTFK